MAGTILEGVFAVAKPPTVTSPQVLIDLQSMFVNSRIFAPLLADTRRRRAEQDTHQPPGQKRKNEEEEGRFFRMGHGGTLDPLAAGVLIVGIGRGTKRLQEYLQCSKTYETVVLFGKGTETYDLDPEGKVVAEAPVAHITEDLIRSRLALLKGKLRQVPPLYSALKINGVKACEYAREGKVLPRDLPSREVEIHDCSLVQFLNTGQHDYHWPGDFHSGAGPAAKIQLTVSSGFYVRSFAYDLGVLCDSLGTMAYLSRTQQAHFATSRQPDAPGQLVAVTYEELRVGEQTWGPLIQEQLKIWMDANPVIAPGTHMDGRSSKSKGDLQGAPPTRPRQRHGDGWQAETRQGRIAQQGGKHKGDNYVYFPKKVKAALIQASESFSKNPTPD